jgi:uridine kinase
MSRPPFIAGIAGGSGSGKSWLAAFLLERLGSRCALICQDWYYKDQRQASAEQLANLNFDHPRAFDTALLIRHLDAVKRGQTIQTPRYDYTTHARHGGVACAPAPIVIVEGIFVLHQRAILRRLDFSVFVDTPADVRLVRRIRRDAAERGLPVEETLLLYERFVRPMHERYVQPSAARAAEIWRPLQDRQFPRRMAAKLKRHSL